MRVAVSGLLLCCIASSGNAGIAWRSLPQHAFASYEAPVYVDLDGDGAKEVVYVTAGGYNATVTSALGVLRFETTAFRQVDLRAFGARHEQPVAFTAPDGSERLLVTVRGSGFDPGTMFEVGGLPLQVIREIRGTTMLPSLVADVDGDGRLEIVGRRGAFQYNLVVHDYATDAVEWSSPERPQAIIAAQLDADPALEIVIGNGELGGMVFDGATGSTDWHYPSRFGPLLAGRFEADPTIPTFATIDDGWLRIFRGAPYSPVREWSPGWMMDPAVALDVDHDGVDEVVTPSVEYDSFSIIEPLDGSVRRVPAQLWGPSAIGIGRVVPLGPVLAAYSNIHSGAGVYVRGQVFNVSAGGLLFDEPVEQGPYNATGFGDLDGDGGAESVVLNRQLSGVHLHHFGLGVVAWDEAGEPLARRTNLVPDVGDHLPTLSIADLDGVAGDEIIVLAPTRHGTQLIVLDGRTLADRWRIELMDLPYSPQGTGIDAIDFDGNGTKEIAMLEPVGNGARISIRSGQDGALIWQSVTLSGGWQGRSSMAVHNVDADPLDEIVVAVGQGVYAFDAATRLLDWSFHIGGSGESTQDVALWGSGPDCRVAVALTTAEIAIHRCGDQARVDSVDGPEALSMIVPVDDAGTLAIIAEGAVWTRRAGELPERYSPYLGEQLGGVRANAVQRMADGDVHLLVGSNVQAYRLRIRPPEIFVDGFELQP